MAEVQADVRELLEANAVINQNITINNDATLLYAETLVGTATDDPNVIVNGFVSVTVNTSNFDAAEIARVNAVTAKLATVLQYVTISNTSSPSVAVDFSNLTFVDGDYSVSGADANDDALRTVSGDLILLATVAQLIIHNLLRLVVMFQFILMLQALTYRTQLLQEEFILQEVLLEL